MATFKLQFRFEFEKDREKQRPCCEVVFNCFLDRFMDMLPDDAYFKMIDRTRDYVEIELNVPEETAEYMASNLDNFDSRLHFVSEPPEAMAPLIPICQDCRDWHARLRQGIY